MSSPRLTEVWAQLYLPLGLTIDQIVEALRGIATLHGAPRVVLEAVGVDGQIQWWVRAAPPVMRTLGKLLPHHLTGAQLVTGSRPSQPPIRRAGQLVAHGHRGRLLAVDRAESVSRAMVQVLAQTTTNERLVAQVVLGVRLRPLSAAPPQKSTPAATERRRLRAEKTAHHGFGCLVRFGVSGTNEHRTRQLLGLLLASVRAAEAPQVALRLRREAPRRIEGARSPWWWPLRLSVREVATLIGWPIGDGPFDGMPAPHPRPVTPLAHVASTGRILGDASAPGPQRPVAISIEDSLRHMLVLGPTGTGKSTFLGGLALQDMEAGRGVVVIDPKQSLVDDLLKRIPAHRRDDVVVLDATDPEPIGINPIVGTDPELAADGLVHLMHELYSENWGPRTNDIMHASLLTLARRGDASLIHVPLLLTNAGFRRSVTGRISRTDTMGLGTFWAWYDAISDAERQSVIAPVMNKLRSVLLRPGLRAILGQTDPRFDLSDVYTKNRILLVSLAKGQLGPDGAKLLGSIVVNLLWQAATRRGPGAERHPVNIFIDELQDYLRLPGDLSDALATARGYGVSFTLATQHLGGVPNHLKSALLANARSRVMFQLSHDDAVVMARGSDLIPEDFTMLGRFQTYASLLTQGAPTPWTSVATRPLPAETSPPEAIRAMSRQTYGRPIEEVERGWTELLEGGAAAPTEALGRQRKQKGGDE